MQYCGIAYLSKCYIIILLEWNKDRQNSMHNTGFHKQDQNMDNSHVTVNNRLPMSVNANATDDFRHFRPIKQHADCCHIWLAKCYFLYVFYRLRFRWNLCWVISHLAKPRFPPWRIRSIYTASFAKQNARRWCHNQYRFITITIAALPHVQMHDAASTQICYRLFTMLSVHQWLFHNLMLILFVYFVLHFCYNFIIVVQTGTCITEFVFCNNFFSNIDMIFNIKRVVVHQGICIIGLICINDSSLTSFSQQCIIII